MKQRQVILVAAVIGILVPVTFLSAAKWGHVNYGVEVFWLCPSYLLVLATDGIEHTWLADAIYLVLILANAALYSAFALTIYMVAAKTFGNLPNQSPDPTLASGKSPAGQEPRHR